MAFEADNIRVAGNTRLYVASLATAFPIWGAAPGAGWTDLGYVTEDGVTITNSREINEIFAMQSAEAVRVVNTRQPKTLGFSLMQQGRDQFVLAMGGGTWELEDEETDVYRYVPPSVADTDERKLLVEMQDGGFTYRWHYKRTQNREGIEHKYTKSDAAVFPISMAVLAPADGLEPYYFVSDDPAFAPAA